MVFPVRVAEVLSRESPLESLSQSYEVLCRFDSRHRIQVAANIDANRPNWCRITESDAHVIAVYNWVNS